jgi:AraC-like DNA-binding protein
LKIDEVKVEIFYMSEILSDKAYPSLQLAEKERELFEQIHQTIVEQQLFLDPGFSRTKFIKIGLVNKNKVARMLQQYAGTNLNGYINGMRLEYAARLLREHPADPIKAIAANSGFNSVRTFYRLFSEKYGMSPVEYKEKL